MDEYTVEHILGIYGNPKVKWDFALYDSMARGNTPQTNRPIQRTAEEKSKKAPFANLTAQRSLIDLDNPQVLFRFDFCTKAPRAEVLKKTPGECLFYGLNILREKGGSRLSPKIQEVHSARHKYCTVMVSSEDTYIYGTIFFHRGI